MQAMVQQARESGELVYGIVPIERRRHPSRITHGNLVFNDDIWCWMAGNCREHRQAGIMKPYQRRTT